MAGQELAYLSREQQLIEEIKSIVGAKFLGDDCARVAGGLLLTTDTFLEGTHFLFSLSSMPDIGFKAMAVNLSDIAAKAGLPRFALVALTVPPHLSRRHFRQLYGGIADCARLYDTVVVGGDLISGPILSITVTIVGEVNQYGCPTRAGARTGDCVVVTGQLGASAAAIEILLRELPQGLPGGALGNTDRVRRSPAINAASEKIAQLKKDYPNCIKQQFRPEPKLSESWQFVKRTGQRGALMDASDGLADALAQIARASQVGMQIELADLPIQPETVRIAELLRRDPLDLALYGGEDYELVGCLPEPIWKAWQRQLPANQIPFKKIGLVTEEAKGIKLLRHGKPDRKLDLEKCFQHIAKPG